jgi:hypothetical protein
MKDNGTGFGWVKSSLSFSNGNCVEVTALPGGGVAVRNSKGSRRAGAPIHSGRVAGIHRRGTARRIRRLRRARLMTLRS